ncbi:MAG: glycosyltransferase family 4 protein [Bacteroidota bacterium]
MVSVNQIQKEFLFITHKYPPSTGGMQKQSYELITQTETYRSIHKIVFKSNYPKIFFFLSIALRAYFKILFHKEIRLIHANDGLMALFLTPLLLIKNSVHLCATIHGLDIVFNSTIYQWWIKRCLSQFSFVIAVSRATQRECVKAGIPKEKVHFIPNAVELPEGINKDPSYEKWLFEEHGIHIDDHFIVCSVGRPVPRKGFGWFASKVLPRLENTKYLVVGTEMERSWIILLGKKLLPPSIFEKICKMLGVPLDNVLLTSLSCQNNNLILMGKIPWKELLQTYLHADLFVMPNLKVKGDFEGFGLVALEAASLGAVCLAANVDGIPSAIRNGENGFLLESANADLWIEKICQLQNRTILKKYKKVFKTYFEGKQITWKEMSHAYISLFDSFLSRINLNKDSSKTYQHGY